MKSPIRRLLIVLIITFILLFIGIFKWGMPGMSFEVPGGKLTEVYTAIGSYDIGKEKFRTNICNKEDGCLDGEILGFKENNIDIYIYISINQGTIKSFDESKILNYYYNIYKYSKRIYIDKLNEIPKYAYLSNNELKFYSEKDLENLSKEQQEIFIKLKENPTIIIDGVDYTKK